DRRLRALSIHGTGPPTLPDRQAPLETNPLSFWWDSQSNRRALNGCTNSAFEIKQAALWPVAAEPWLPYAKRRRGQLPAFADGCSAPTSAPVKIEHAMRNSIYRRAGESSSHPAIPLAASGGEGRYHWYMYGRFLHTSPPTQLVELAQPGVHQILVVDDAGNLDKLDITVE